MNSGTRTFHFRLRSIPAALFLTVFVAGFFATGWTVKRTDRDLRNDLLQQTRLLGQAIDIEIIRGLSGSVSDIENPEYQRLKGQLIAARHLIPDCRFIYLLRSRAVHSAAGAAGSEVYFLVDSEPAESMDCSPPGQVYTEDTAESRRVFENAQSSITVGPYTDRWGTWVSTRVPLTDPVTGGLVAVAGLDVDARTWRRAVVRSAMPPLVFALALMAVLMLGAYLLRRRLRPTPCAQPGWRGHLESALVLAVGLVLTLAAAWYAHECESRNRDESFKSLAASKTAGLIASLSELKNVELEGLASFFIGSTDITSEDFENYTRYLAKTPRVQAWEWIPAVPERNASLFEQKAREAGLPGFEIWQKEADGRRAPASGRGVYYPVFNVAPLAGNERALGFDLGSEPIRRATLEEAARTGLTTGTDPITLVQETGNQKGMLICRPVYVDGGPKQLRGFALAVLRLGTALTSADPDRTASVEWSLLHSNGDSELLASSCANDGSPASSAGLTASRPVLVFGKVFAVTAHAGPEFMRSHPVRAGWLTVLTGLLLTATLSLLADLALRRREQLERRVAERTADLQLSEERHRAMFEKNRSIQLLIDPGDGAIIDANSSACEFYGYPLERLKQMKISEINTLPPEELQQQMEFARSEQLSGFHFRHRLADGAVRNVEVHSSPIPVSGRICLYSIIHDITERTHAEQIIERLNEIQRHLMLLATEFVNVPVDRQNEAIRQALTTLGKLIHADRAYLFDYDFASGVMSNTYEWCAAGIAPQISNLQHVSLSIAPDWVDRHRRGELVHVPSVASLGQNDPLKLILSCQGIQSLITLPLMASDGCLGFVGFDAVASKRVWGADEIALLRVLAEMFANFKMRRKAETDLRQMNAERGMLLDTMSAQVWYLKDPATYGLANRAHADFLGLPREAIQHKRLDTFLPPEVASVCLQSNGDVFANRQALQTQEWATSGTGERRLLEIFKNPFIDEDGSVAYVVCVGHDITEKQRLQEELVQSRDEAERTARAKATFLADMSHEIRTPLNVILGYAQIMDHECVACPQKRNIQVIRKSGELLLDLINDILAGSERDSRSMPLNESAFDLLQLADDVRLLFARHPDARGLAIETHCAADLPRHIAADKGKIRQVLLNLLGNAIKFTAQGSIRMRLRLADRHEPFLPDRAEEGTPICRIAVEIHDSGCGIPEDGLESIFEPYVKIDTPSTKRIGSGIGLPLSRRYAQALGGDLTVTSRVGEGSIFTFTFVARITAPTASGLPEEPALRVLCENGLAPRILVVDDNSAGRDMQVAMLKAAGFETETSADGEGALVRLSQGEHFHLILLDKRMPGIDGLETLKRLRALPAGKDVPVLLFTASGLADEAAVVNALGGNGVLHKPIKMDCLLREIQRVTGALYSESAAPRAAQHTAARDCTFSPGALPEHIRARMAAAVRRGEIRALQSLVREIESSAPGQAALIAKLVDSYDYDSLSQLLAHGPR